MKPIKTSGRLKLNKETLRQLSTEEMGEVAGGSILNGCDLGPIRGPWGPVGGPGEHSVADCNPVTLSEMFPGCPGPTRPF